jgi:DNA-directed RNA polymerase subunit K/omega
MNSEMELPEAGPTEKEAAAEPAEASKPDPPRERMPPVESRFLYVDVAARRAKQLRRGALPRLAALAPDPETGERPPAGTKLERIAMEEVDEGLIVYELPASQPATEDPS